MERLLTDLLILAAFVGVVSLFVYRAQRRREREHQRDGGGADE